MRKIIILILVVVCIEYTYGQQLQQFSFRSFDLMNCNPAVAGSRINSQIKLHHRSQWVGFENAPQTELLNFNTSISKIGIGGAVYYDSEVTMKNFGANLMYAYHLFFNRFNLSLGMTTGILQYQFNLSRLTPYEDNDPLITSKSMHTKLMPDVGGGIFIYNEDFYIGSSFLYYVPSKKFYDDDNNMFSSLFYYAMGGYNFKMSKFFNIQIQASYVGTPNFNSQLEFGTRGQFKETFLLGVAYRPKDAVIYSLGLKISKSIYITYSYDMVISKLKNCNSGSHELVLTFEFGHDRPAKYEDRTSTKRKINSNIVF
jgi:type IX secretion system PorP/SprF family membrane protein